MSIRCRMSEVASFLKAGTDGVFIKVYVQPRSGKNEIAGTHENSLKIRLAAPPVEGEANRECVRFISRLLGIPKSRVEIVQGLKSRHKTLFVHDHSLEAVEKVLIRSLEQAG